MNVRFFKIVGVFSYISAALALIAAIGLFAMSGLGLMGRVHETIEKPKINVQDFIKKKADENSTKTEQSSSDDPAEIEARNANAEVLQKQIKPVFNRIVSAINKFASQTNQQTVNEAGLEKYIIENTKELNGDPYLDFLSALAKEAETLASRGTQIAALPQNDPTYIKWNEYFSWYIETYMHDYRRELQRISQEQQEKLEGRAQALVLLGTAAGAFFVFVFFTMILLLVQIEANTRYSHQAASALLESGGKIELNTRATAMALRPKPAVQPAKTA